MEQREHHASKKLIEAHEWLEVLESAGKRERVPACSVCTAGSPVEDTPFCALEARLPSWFVEWPTRVEIDYVENRHIAALSDGRNLRDRNARVSNNIASQIQRDVAKPPVAARSTGRSRWSRTENANKINAEKRHMDNVQTDGLPNFDDKSDSNEPPGILSHTKYVRICWLMQHFDAEELHLAALRKEQKIRSKKVSIIHIWFRLVIERT